MKKAFIGTFGILLLMWLDGAAAGSRMLGGRSPSGWQVFIIPGENGPQFAMARGGQRLKYAIDINAAENRVPNLDALEARLRNLKRLQWVAVDQWEQGTSTDELAFIKERLNAVCLNQKLGCVYSF